MKLSHVLTEVNKRYGPVFRLVGKFQDGFRNDVFKLKDSVGKFFVLIVYKKEDGILQTINNTHAVAKFLKTKNFPVRLPISTLRNQDYFKFQNQRYIALYNYLPGETIPWDTYKRRHLKAIGKTLSDMHFFLKDFRGANLPKWKPQIIQEISEMARYYKKVSPWVAEKLGVKVDTDLLLEQLLFLKLMSIEKSQTLHYDFVRGNILFSSHILDDDTYEISGIIDLEKVCLGPVEADVARTLSFLIVDCKFKSEEDVWKWFLERGYIKRGKNKASINLEQIKELVTIYWLRDWYKFLLHNPYEDLLANEHYLRTVEQLIKVKALTYS